MDQFELYNKEGKHIGYGIKNILGGYDLLDDHHHYIGEAHKLWDGSMDIFDKRGNRIGYLDVEFMNGRTIHLY